MKDAEAPAKGVYTAGTLQYTRMGLIVLFGWLLWGDFCFTLMEDVLPRIFPLYMLDTLGTNNTITTLLMVTIPNIFGIAVGPAVSFKSDRYRSKWGRRIPFIMWTAPLLVVALIGLGFSETFHQFFKGTNGIFGLSPMTATLIVIGFFMILFAFMNEFVNSVFWYLFADVVPEQLLGRFLALFRLVATFGHFLFNAFVFKYAQSHMQWIFLGAGLLYLVGFSLMCWRVKEGEYPPPDDLGEKPSIFKQASVYIRECFGHPIYVLLFTYTGMQAFSRCAGIGAIIFNKDALGLTLGQLAAVAAASNVISMVLQYPSGWLVDKFHPLRMSLAMQIVITPIQFAMFFWLVGWKTYVAFEMIKLVFFSLYGAAGIPLLITIFPKDKYGQYCSCNGMMKSFAMLIGAVIGAIFIDYMTNNGANKDAYRWMFMWNGWFQVLSIVCLLIIYAMWKARGGDKGYVAPGSAVEKEMLARKAREAAPAAA